MTKLADALEGGHSTWRGVPYLRIDGDTDSCERLEVLLAVLNSPEATLRPRHCLLNLSLTPAWPRTFR